MNPISVSPEFEQFIDEEVSSGRFQSREEVVAEALRQFRDRERQHDELRADIQDGIDQLERGECTVISSEREHREFFADIERRAQDHLQASPGSSEK